MIRFKRLPATQAAVIPAAVLASVAVLSVAGCQQKLMPTPVAFYQGNADPFAHVREADKRTTYDIYLFTDREPSGKASPASFYSSNRSREGRLATATVEVGGNMDWEELSRESVRERRDRNPTIELVRLDEIGLLWTTVPPEPARFARTPVADAATKAPAEQFAADVNAKLSRSHLKDIFIFVHGFNTKFDENLELAAELHHYLGREGVFVSVAWPSRHSVWAYGADKASARYSTRMFRLFLTFLAKNTDARRINILAHSAGAPIAVEALRQVRLVHYDEDAPSVQAKYRIGQFVLVAADMDLFQYINALLDGLEDIPDRLSIYISTKDVALDLSGFLFKSARVGEPLHVLTPKFLKLISEHTKLDVIDVTAAEEKHGSWLGHSYFHKDPWVSSDLLLLMKYGLPARDRGLSREDNGALWTFPKDYPQRVRAIATDLDEAGISPETRQEQHRRD